MSAIKLSISDRGIYVYSYVETCQLPPTGYFSSPRLPHNDTVCAKSNMKKIRVLGYVAQCGLVNSYRRVEGARCLHLQGTAVLIDKVSKHDLNLYKRHNKNYKSLNMGLLPSCYLSLGDRGSTVLKVLCYKSEGRWFDPSWCQWIFH